MQIYVQCSDRIDDELQQREEQLEELFTKAEGEDEEEADEAWGELHTMDYGITEMKTYRVIWSGGGPADFIEITTDETGEIQKVEYIFQDWYDGARTSVSRDTFVWKYAEMIIEGRVSV